MPTTLLRFLAVAILLVSFRLAAEATPATPMRYHLTTARWVVATRDNLDVDDRYVTLIGKVTQQIDDDTWWFTDGTGSVRLDCEKPLPLNAKVILGGRIDQAYLGFGHLEVDVKRWQYAEKP